MTRLLAIVMLLFGAISARAASVNSGLVQLETGLENELQRKIDQIIGDQGKIVINLVLDQRAKKRAAASLDMPYAPLGEGELGTPDASTQYEIEAARINLLVAPATPAALVTVAKNLLAMRLRRVPHTIAVVHLPAEKVAAVAPPPAPREPTWRDHLANWMSLLGPALLVFFGIALLARAMGGVARTVGSFAPPMTVGPFTLERSREPTVSLATSLNEAERNVERNLQIARKTLREEPLLFARELKSTPADLRGLKGLLPSLDEESLAIVRQYVGRARLAMAAQLPVDAAAEPFPPWLESFIERLTLQKIQSESSLKKLIGPKRLAKLASVPTAALWRAAEGAHDKATWRLLTELVPSDELAESLARLSTESWALVLGAASAGEAECGEAADRLLEKLEAQQPAGRVSDEEYAARLLEPTLAALRKKTFDDQETWMRDRQATSPEFAASVSDRFWTVSALDRVPDEPLVARLRGANYVQLASILFSLPALPAKRLEKLIPEGKVRVMALDQLSRMRKRDTEKDRVIALQIAAQFIDRLREDARDGKFSVAATPAPTRAAA